MAESGPPAKRAKKAKKAGQPSDSYTAGSSRMATDLIGWIKNKELRARANQAPGEEINWFTGDIGKLSIPGKTATICPDPGERIQQSDLMKPLLREIAENGLEAAYKSFPSYVFPSTTRSFPAPGSVQQTKHPKDVIIVGAGMAGLCAAYELNRVGHRVQILEMTQRAGGRVKTFDEEDGFDKGLHSDGGAMRLPGTMADINAAGGIWTRHFMTNFYGNAFNLGLIPFKNTDKNGFYKFYNEAPVQMKDWTPAHFNKHWQDWDKTFSNEIFVPPEFPPTDINDYYSKTAGLVGTLLRQRLCGCTTIDKQAEQWRLWIERWSQFSVDSFLRNTYSGIIEMAKFDINTEANLIKTLEPLKKLLPWPDEALQAYKVFNYTPSLDVSIVELERDSLGDWWEADMHAFNGGLSALPNAFEAVLRNFITYNRTVSEVVYTYNTSAGGSVHVDVKGVFTKSGMPFSVGGDAVILTVPLNVLRGIKISSSIATDPFPSEFQKAIDQVWYSPSTKVMLQYKTKFWEKDGIKGGFSKTNRPIGQLHYPTAIAGEKDKKGILMVYTWKSEALLFGSMTKSTAIQMALSQIDEIHPQSSLLYETGEVQAWYSDPSTLGAFTLLKPHEYYNVLYLMLNSWKNVYFAGEAISFANGWIQGALVSGLRAAFQFYSKNENLYKK